MVTLTLPHRTSFLVIKHPVYGQLAWKVPDGVLKRKSTIMPISILKVWRKSSVSRSSGR